MDLVEDMENIEFFVQSNEPFSWVTPFNPKTNGEFHEYIWSYISLGVVQNKIYWLGVDISEDSQSKHGPNRHPIYH